MRRALFVIDLRRAYFGKCTAGDYASPRPPGSDSAGQSRGYESQGVPTMFRPQLPRRHSLAVTWQVVHTIKPTRLQQGHALRLPLIACPAPGRDRSSVDDQCPNNAESWHSDRGCGLDSRQRCS